MLQNMYGFSQPKPGRSPAKKHPNLTHRQALVLHDVIVRRLVHEARQRGEATAHSPCSARQHAQTRWQPGQKALSRIPSQTRSRCTPTGTDHASSWTLYALWHMGCSRKAAGNIGKRDAVISVAGSLQQLCCAALVRLMCAAAKTPSQALTRQRAAPRRRHCGR